MPGNYKKPQAQITFDALMESVHSEFTEIPISGARMPNTN